MLCVQHVNKIHFKHEKVFTYHSDFILPGVSVGVDENIGEEKAGWQPISAISLQQLFKLWQFWSQRHPLFSQGGDSDITQHP